MKKILFSIPLFLCLFHFMSASEYDIQYRGAISSVNGEFGDHHMYSEYSNGKSYIFADYDDTNEMSKKWMKFISDFTTSPIDYVELPQNQYDFRFTASCSDTEGNIYVVAQFPFEEVYEGILLAHPSPETYQNIVIKYSENGDILDTAWINSTNMQVYDIEVNGNDIYYAMGSITQTYIGYKSFDNDLASENLDVLPPVEIDGNDNGVISLELQNDILYIAATHNQLEFFPFGASNITPVSSDFYYNSYIGTMNTLSRTRIDAISISGTYRNSISDINVDPEGNIYATGNFSDDLTIQDFAYTPSSYHNHQYIIKLDNSLNLTWLQTVKNNQDRKSQICLTENSVFASGNYHNYQGDGSFILNIGSKLYNNVPFFQTGIYLTQLDINSGNIIDSEVFYGEEVGNSFSIYNLEYNGIDQELNLLMYPAQQDINCTNGTAFPGNAYDVVNVAIRNIDPQFHVNDFYNTAENIKPYTKCAGAAFELAIDLRQNIYHPDFIFEDLFITYNCREGIVPSILDGFLYIDSYEKAGRGYDTIEIVVRDPLGARDTGYLYLYEVDPPVFTWDISDMQRCEGSVPVGSPTPLTTEFLFPTDFQNYLDYGDPYISTNTTDLYDGSLFWNWNGSTIPAGEYDMVYDFNYEIFSSSLNLLCNDTVMVPGYNVNTAPATAGFVLPDTICSSIWLEDYIDIAGGIFSVNLDGFIPFTPYDFSNSYYDYEFYTGTENDIAYEVFDETTGCTVTDTLRGIYVKQAPSRPNPNQSIFNYCSNDADKIIESGYSALDTVIWYNDFYRYDSVTSGYNLLVDVNHADTLKYYGSHYSNGCASVPQTYEMYIDYSPLFSPIGDTLLCYDEVYTSINLEEDPYIDPMYLTYNWLAISGGTGATFSDASATLSEGEYLCNIINMNSSLSCRTIDTITISQTTVVPPLLSDTTVIYGSPAPSLTAEGDSIRWYNETETLIAEGNTINTGVRAIGTYNYMVTETEGNCESIYDTVTINIITCPAVAPSLSFDTLSYCQNDPIFVLDANNASVRWFADENKQFPIDGTDSVAFTGLASGFHTYYAADYDSSNQCFSIVTAATLEINPTPLVYINLSQVSNEYDTINLMAYAHPQGGLFSGNNIAQDSLYITTDVPVGTDSISYVYTNELGCFDTAIRNIELVAGSVVAESVNFTDDTLRITVNESRQLSVQFFPANTTYQTVNWAIRTPGIASVNPDGTVTGITADTTEVIATWTEDETIADTIIIVVKAPVPVRVDLRDTICFDADAYQLTAGRPVGGSYFGGAVVDGYFEPELAIVGTNNVGYTYTDAFGNIDSSSCTVFVKQPAQPIVNDTTVAEGSTIPNLNALGDSIVWFDNRLVSTPIAYGEVFDHGQTEAGTYNYYVVNVFDGCQSEPVLAQLTILANDTIYASSIAATTDTLYITENQTSQLRANIYPSNATIPTYEWNIDDSNIATISASGMVSGISADTTFAVVNWTADANINDTVTIIVLAPQAVIFEDAFDTICSNADPIVLSTGLPIGGTYFGDAVYANVFVPAIATEGINVIGYTYSDAFGNTDTVYSDIYVITTDAPIVLDVITVEGSTVMNLEASGDSVIWYSDRELTTQVTTGNIFEHGHTEIGTYTYYAVNFANGCYSYPTRGGITILANDTINVSSIRASADTLTLTTGQSALIRASFSPANATVQTVNWTSTDESIATIDQSGLITAIEEGTCFITVSSTQNAALIDTVVVNVNATQQVSLNTFDTICHNDAPFRLTGGEPEGGYYIGSAVENNYFYPSRAINGDNILAYVYTNEFGNADTALNWIHVNMVYTPLVSNITGIENSEIPPLTVAEGVGTIWYTNFALTDTVATGTTFEHNQTTEGVYTYYVVNTAEGCSSIPTAVTLTIEPCLLATPSVAVRTIIQCEDALELPSFIATAANEILWYGSADTVIATGREFTPVADTISTTNYTVRQYNGSCYSSPLTVQHIYSASPAATIVLADTITTNNPTIATVEIANTDNYYTEWDINTHVVSGNNAELIFYNEGNYVLYATVTDTQTGCSSVVSDNVVVIEEYFPVQSINMTEDTIALFTGFDYEIDAEILPNYANNRTVLWSVTDENVANVNNGLVEAIIPGTTWLYATALDNDLTDSVLVVVSQYYPVTSIILPQTIYTYVGDTLSVETSVLPDNASISDVLFIEDENPFISITEDGTLIGTGAGISTITAISHDGLQQASTAVIVLEALLNPFNISIPSATHVVVGESYTFNTITQPYLCVTEDMIWSSADASILTVNTDGTISPIATGNTTITVTDTVSGATATSAVRITNSHAPVFYPVPRLSITQVADTLIVDLSLWASDDSTSTNNLIWSMRGADRVNAPMNGSVVTFTPAQNDYIGTDTLIFSVTDEEGSVTQQTVIIELLEKENEAPIFIADELFVPFADGYNSFDLASVIYDDFTAPSQISWSVIDSGQFNIDFSSGHFVIGTSVAEWFGIDTIILTATDHKGLSTTDSLFVNVTDKPNDAPVISGIPTQYNNDTLFFSYINLNKYVSDDYTANSEIRWSFSHSHMLEIISANHYGIISITNPFWSGAELITFTATDEHGASTSVNVLFLQEQPRTEGWIGEPGVNIFANKEFGTPSDTITLYASLSGASSWRWEVESTPLRDSSAVIQDIVFSQPGHYTVSLWAINDEGTDVMIKEDYITIYGIEDRSPAICIGDELILSVNDTTLDSYRWSTGDSTFTTISTPSLSTEYTVTITDGLFTFVDKVPVRVSVPVDLGIDTAICAESIYNINPGIFEEYWWSTGDTSQTIGITHTGEYSISVVDDLGCVSIDTLNIIGINPLPELNLGNDTTLCDGEIISLDAGIGYQYNWTTGYRGQQVVIDSTTTIGVEITDENRCVSNDDITVTFRYPYNEQIGVVTFSQTSNNIVIAWEKTQDVNTMKYQVYRETNVTNTWSLVQEIDFDQPAIVVDSMANYIMKPYRYVLVTIDSCGNSSAQSISHRSMHLQTSWSALEANHLNVSWTPYEPASAVETYIIYKGEDDNSLIPIDSLSSDNTQWTDPESEEGMKYRVVFRLFDVVYPDTYNSLKSESGPYSQALSNITESTIEIVDIENSAINADIIVYPVPIQNTINIAIAGEEDRYSIALFNMNGQTIDIIETETITKQIVQFNSENIPQGVYSIKISNSKGSKLIKVIK